MWYIYKDPIRDIISLVVKFNKWSPYARNSSYVEKFLKGCPLGRCWFQSSLFRVERNGKTWPHGEKKTVTVGNRSEILFPGSSCPLVESVRKKKSPTIFVETTIYIVTRYKTNIFIQSITKFIYNFTKFTSNTINNYL